MVAHANLGGDGGSICTFNAVNTFIILWEGAVQFSNFPMKSFDFQADGWGERNPLEGS